MRKKTKDLQTESWIWLRMNPELNGFRNKEQFQQEWKELEEVSGDGNQSYFTRLNPADLFEPGNVAVVNVQTSNDWNSVTNPAVGGFHNEQ